MSDPDLHLDAAEQQLADRLAQLRPTPAGPFRGALSRRLAAIDPGYHHRPQHLWAQAAAFTAGGAVALLLGLLIAKGSL